MIDNQAYKYDIHEAAISVAKEADNRAFYFTTTLLLTKVYKIIITSFMCQTATQSYYQSYLNKNCVILCKKLNRYQQWNDLN